jgi:hypothetical protein
MSVGQQNTRRNAQASGGAKGEDAADWDAVKQDVSELADVAVERGKSFVDSARAQATEYVDRRKSAAAESVSDLAGALRDSGKAFDDRPNIRAFFEVGADGLEQLAEAIEGRDLNEIYAEAEHLLRRRPGLAAVATFVAGFLVSRFIKASAETVRDEAQRQARARTSRGPRRPAQARA